MSFIFALLFISSFAAGTGIRGAWKNNLGSIAYFVETSNTTFSGEYNSAVGKAAGNYSLFGKVSLDLSVISWTVMWQNGILDTDSMTSWVGLYTKDFIITTYLEVTGSLPSWRSTTVGQSLFYRLG